MNNRQLANYREDIRQAIKRVELQIKSIEATKDEAIEQLNLAEETIDHCNRIIDKYENILNKYYDELNEL